MTRTRLIHLALLASLAAPAAAQNLDALMAPLSAPQGQDGLLAALAACMAGNGDAAATADRFTAAGWARSDDDEMGVIDLNAPAAGLSAMLGADGGFCVVYANSLGTPAANATVMRLAVQGQVMMEPAQGPMDCGGYVLGGALVEVTSTGQDPTCASDTDSAIRVTFAK